jgi:beta-lactamase regulating signal transducer with metallopeptidase domain
MMTLMDRVSIFVASSGMSIATKATLVLLLTLGAVCLARRSRASTRHLLLSAGFAVLLLLPFVTVVSSAVRVQLWTVPPVVGEFINGPAFSERSTQEIAPSLSARAAQRVADRIRSQGSLVSVIWTVGTLVFLAPLFAGICQTRRLRLAGRPWPAGQTVVDALVHEAGLRHVTVLLHEGVATPATWGVRRHVILFPVDALTWSDEDVRRAAIHEVEHARRGDGVINIIVRAVCAVYWFHPLVWIALQRLCLEAERASDDAVLRHADSAAYAEQLVALAGRLPVKHRRDPLMAIVSRRDLVRRVTAILDERQSRGQVSTPLALAIKLAAIVVIVALCAIQSPAQAVSEDRLVGLWDIQSTAAGNQIVLRLCYAELFSRSELSPEQMTWWTAADLTGPVRFGLSRDAGSFTFEGTVANNMATGSFTFEPSPRFVTEMRQRGQLSLTPSQYLALAQHDIGLAAIDAQARLTPGGVDPLHLIGEAQIRAHLEDRMSRGVNGVIAFQGMC